MSIETTKKVKSIPMVKRSDLNNARFYYKHVVKNLRNELASSSKIIDELMGENEVLNQKLRNANDLMDKIEKDSSSQALIKDIQKNKNKSIFRFISR